MARMRAKPYTERMAYQSPSHTDITLLLVPEIWLSCHVWTSLCVGLLLPCRPIHCLMALLSMAGPVTVRMDRPMQLAVGYQYHGTDIKSTQHHELLNPS